MSKQANPNWVINDNWAVSTDPYNWILYKRSGKAWRATGYYPTPEMLLKSLHRKLTRSEPPHPTVELHIEHCLGAAQAAAARLLGSLATYPLPVIKARPAVVHSMLKGRLTNHAS